MCLHAASVGGESRIAYAQELDGAVSEDFFQLTLPR